jgi:hypothetical protein
MLETLHILAPASMKTAVLWDAAQYSLVEIDWRFRGTYCFDNWLITMMV